jgi:hypothetical protein
MYAKSPETRPDNKVMTAAMMYFFLSSFDILNPGFQLQLLPSSNVQQRSRLDWTDWFRRSEVGKDFGEENKFVYEGLSKNIIN